MIKHIVFHQLAFKRGVQCIPCQQKIIYYINPKDFDDDEEAFGLCGVDVSFVSSRVRITPEQLRYFVMRMRTSVDVPDNGDDITVRLSNGTVVCRIGDRTIEPYGNESLKHGFIKWAIEAMNEHFEEYDDD